MFHDLGITFLGRQSLSQSLMSMCLLIKIFGRMSGENVNRLLCKRQSVIDILTIAQTHCNASANVRQILFVFHVGQHLQNFLRIVHVRNRFGKVVAAESRNAFIDRQASVGVHAEVFATQRGNTGIVVCAGEYTSDFPNSSGGFC